MSNLTDHEILMWTVIFLGWFFLIDFIWKVFGVQKRLKEIEKRLGIDIYK